MRKNPQSICSHLPVNKHEITEQFFVERIFEQTVKHDEFNQSQRDFDIQYYAYGR